MYLPCVSQETVSASLKHEDRKRTVLKKKTKKTKTTKTTENKTKTVLNLSFVLRQQCRFKISIL